MTEADSARKQALQQQIEKWRQQGYRVIVPLSEDDCPADVTHRLSLADESWQLININ